MASKEKNEVCSSVDNHFLELVQSGSEELFKKAACVQKNATANKATKMKVYVQRNKLRAEKICMQEIRRNGDARNKGKVIPIERKNKNGFLNEQ